MVGKVLKGQYRIERVLGQGAMGVVYRGVQETLGKQVAIKMLIAEGYPSGDALDRFKREATVASKLVHPGVPQVFEFGVEEDSPFLVMEYVEGQELTDILEKDGPWEPTRALTLLRQLTSVLKEAQRHKLIHRDIKPSNLLLTRYTKTSPIYLKVLDFGIAKEVGTGQGKLTATGAIVGTPMYMSPEQAEGEVKKIDGRTDQYSAGVVLYELLAGHPPFEDDTAAGLLFSHINHPPPPLPEIVPAPLRDVVMRMLMKKPADRFPNPDALDRALQACEKACRDVPSAPRPSRFSLGNGLLAASLSALGLTRTSDAAPPSKSMGFDATMSADEHPKPTLATRRLAILLAGLLLFAACCGLVIYTIRSKAVSDPAATISTIDGNHSEPKAAPAGPTASGASARKKGRATPAPTSHSAQ
jgi:serine/threonine-protein kinase